VDRTLPQALVVENASFRWELSRDALEKLRQKEMEVKAGKGGRSGGGRSKTIPAVEEKEKEKDEHPPFALANLNMLIPRGGGIYAIVGMIGSGKSSLLQGTIIIARE
jgi:ABC-type transport system involved in cytochrome bd biosynthesis fused ATPase/permease subunit